VSLAPEPLGARTRRKPQQDLILRFRRQLAWRAAPPRLPFAFVIAGNSIDRNTGLASNVSRAVGHPSPLAYGGWGENKRENRESPSPRREKIHVRER